MEVMMGWKGTLRKCECSEDVGMGDAMWTS